jgi:hypothetical protein
MKKKATPRAKIIPDERYLIKSTGCEVKLVGYTDGGKEFAYTNRSNNRANNYQDKPNFTTTNEAVDRNIYLETWITIQS